MVTATARQLDRKKRSFALPAEDLPKLSDDPVRMYLTQMADIPLLTREQEISLAKKIEVTRKRFRRSVLGCNFAMQATIDTLDKVHHGLLPFDRTIKVSLTERLTKEQIMARMPHNLKTLRHILAAQPRRFPQADPPQHGAGRMRCEARRSFCRRRRKSLQLGRRVEPAHPPRAAAGEAVARNLAADGCSAPHA